MFSNDLGAAILAGGKNRRMGGQDKAFLKIQGSSLIEKEITVLKAIFPELILVTNAPEKYSAFTKDCRIVSDQIKDSGPLGGMHAALSVTAKQGLFFIAVDMPYVHNEIIEQQVASFDPVKFEASVAKIGEKIEPLHAIYLKPLTEPIADYLKQKSDYSVRGFLKTINTCYFNLEDNGFNRKLFKNINTPEDLKPV